MQGLQIGSETIAHIVEAGILAVVGFIGLKIQIAIANAKEELLEKSHEMRADMDEKHAENSQAIAVHAASDEAKFDSISRTLVRMDGKLDRMNGHS